VLDVTDDEDAIARVGLFTNVLLAELAINEEPLAESFVVLMTFTDDVVVIVVGGVVVVLVVVVVALAVQYKYKTAKF